MDGGPGTMTWPDWAVYAGIYRNGKMDAISASGRMARLLMLMVVPTLESSRMIRT